MQGSGVESVRNEATGEAAEILACEPVALPPELAARAGVFPALRDSWLERAMEVFRFVGLARRVRMVRRSWRLFRQASNFAAIVTPGDLEGLTVAALERPRGRKRPIHVVYECVSYGGGRLRRAWVQNKEGA